MSNVDAEALQSLASMYKDGTLKVSSVEVVNGVKAKYFKLDGTQITHELAKEGNAAEGCLYRAGGQVHIGVDDRLVIRDNARNKDINIDAHTETIKLGQTTIKGHTKGMLRIQGDSAKYVEIGTADKSWGRIQTNAPSFYMNKKISLNGSIGHHGKDQIDLRKLVSHSSIGAYAIDGGGSTIPLIATTGKGMNLSKNEPRDGNMYGWASDRWDLIYLCKGWEITLWHDEVGVKHLEGPTKNTKHKLQLVDLRDRHNKATSYKLEWKGW